MTLTPTAQRMLDTLPAYYWDNEIVRRILQARANEIDRIDARLDVLKAGLVPGTATDELGLLSAWEDIFELPIAPPGATVSQRQQAIRAALHRRNAVRAMDVVDLLEAAIGPNFTVYRNTPNQLQDTIEIPYTEGSYLAGIVVAIARRAWSAHRQVFIHFETGFILDVSLLDQGTF